MAEPTTHETANEDFSAHVRDYSGFIRLFKYGAVLSFVTAMIVLMLIS